jgi:hypothetical protein
MTNGPGDPATRWICPSSRGLCADLRSKDAALKVAQWEQVSPQSAIRESIGTSRNPDSNPEGVGPLSKDFRVALEWQVWAVWLPVVASSALALGFDLGCQHATRSAGSTDCRPVTTDANDGSPPPQVVPQQHAMHHWNGDRVASTCWEFGNGLITEYYLSPGLKGIPE